MRRFLRPRTGMPLLRLLRSGVPLVLALLACTWTVPAHGQVQTTVPPSPTTERTAASSPSVDSILDVPPAQPSHAVSRSATPPSRPYRPRRLWWGLGSAALLDTGAMAALYQFWYANTDLVRWHWYDQPGGRAWYDDWFTYVQQDKLGHVYSSWGVTRLGFAYGRWSGLSRPKSVVLGMGVSLFFHSQIEFFDGFSAAYGASRTDLLANAAGSALAGTQLLYPDRTDGFTLKYSYQPSPYYDPTATLGNTIQDYQGITFWLSLRPARLLPEPVPSYWPEALALSVGHSGTGLERAVSGFKNSPTHRRQILLGPDLVLGELLDLPDRLRPLESILSFVRLPLPALQVAPSPRWHWVYF